MARYIASVLGLESHLDDLRHGEVTTTKFFLTRLEKDCTTLWSRLGYWLSVEATWFTYKIALCLPVLQFITLVSQWGPPLQNQYNVFARQKYWGEAFRKFFLSVCVLATAHKQGPARIPSS